MKVLTLGYDVLGYKDTVRNGREGRVITIRNKETGAIIDEFIPAIYTLEDLSEEEIIS